MSWENNAYRDELDAAMDKAGYETGVLSTSYSKFAAFLGYPNPEHKNHYIVDVSKPEVRRLIDMINGPYGHAVLKMLEIKHKEREHANNHQL